MCLKIVKESWPSSSISITKKLRVIKQKLKKWNHDSFGNIDSNIARLESTIQDFDNKSNHRSLNSDELDKKKLAQADLWLWMKRKELYWAQNSRISWLRDGDRNTKFFHAIASNKRRKNAISSIEVDGSTEDDPSKIKTEAREFFKKIFEEDCPIRPVFEGLNFKCLSQDQAESLIKPFTNEEIDAAVSSCDSDKAPGPDGFNFKFVKSAWDVIKHDMYAIINEFYASSKLPQGSNTAYIALIPKIDEPKEFKQYRPISMVGSIYKIIAKMLAKRLQSVMSSIVGPLQSSYIKDRQILDGALIAGELIDTCKNKNIEAALFKLDFHKAYDSVSWIFLEWILIQMKFPHKWRKWIMSCVSTAS